MSYSGNVTGYYGDESAHGNYQFLNLKDIINNFIIGYVGEDKIISKTNRFTVAFHAKRALQELSFDVFKSCKAVEFKVPNTLLAVLPHDYVNYTKLSWSDSSGIKHTLYPTKLTSNPKQLIVQSDGIGYQENENVFTATATFSVVTSGDQYIILDDWYPHIIPGLYSIGSQVVQQMNPGKNKIYSNTKTADGKSKIKLWDGIGVINISAPQIEATEVIHIYEDFGIQCVYEDSVSLTNISINKDTNVLVANSVSDASQVKIGSIVSTGTSNKSTSPSTTMYDTFGGILPVVTGVDGKYITLNTKAVTAYSTTSETEPMLFENNTIDRETWNNYKGTNIPERTKDNYEDDTYWPLQGERYGLDPQHAQSNGSYYIDCAQGKIHFSSNLSGETIILDYISDSLGNEDEMKVHKFAEEAMYKSIAYGILSTKSNVQEYIVGRYKKERKAAIRQAKLRLSNIKLEELTQILRGKSKWIKH